MFKPLFYAWNIMRKEKPGINCLYLSSIVLRDNEIRFPSACGIYCPIKNRKIISGKSLNNMAIKFKEENV